jgi:hypothetical protein
MHPEWIRALANARHADLLDEGRPRRHPRARPEDDSPPFPRARQRAGSLLSWAGGCLIGDKRAGLELTHK